MNMTETFKMAVGATACAALAVLFGAFGSNAALAQTDRPTVSAPIVMIAQATPATTDSATPPAAPDASAGPAITPPPATAVVENPFGLSGLWEKGDFVSRGTLIILVIMSAGTWYIMITKLIEQSSLLRQGKEANEKFWNAGSVASGVNTLGKRSAFRFLAEDGIRATEHHEGSLTDSIDLHTWVTMSLQRSVEAINNRVQGGLAFLGTVGSTAPFVGLFGTVWGIYHALIAIGLAGQASIDKVAGPVGEALIMTAFGLLVAVPAVLGYNWLIRRNKAAMDRVRNFAADLHALLVANRSSSTSSIARSA
jgi:biopolymer transport protein ExbB